MKCDNCGRFTRRLHPVWCNPPSGGIEREICDRCAPCSYTTSTSDYCHTHDGHLADSNGRCDAA